MPQVATDPAQASLMEELMRQKGLLATGGNIRMLPFGSATTSPNGSSNGSASTSSLGSASAAVAPSDTEPVVDPTGNVVDPRTGQALDDQTAADWWKYILVGGAVGGGYALAGALRNRFKGTTPVDSDGVPVVEGEVIDPKALPNEQVPVEGQFTDVKQNLLTGPTNDTAPQTAAEAIAQRRGLPRPSPSLEDRGSPPQYKTAQEIARMKGANRPGVAGSGPAIQLGDAMQDIAPEDLEAAKEIARRLMLERSHGNVKGAQGKKITQINRRDVPELKGGATGSVDDEGLLNTVIGILRKNAATIRRVAP